MSVPAKKTSEANDTKSLLVIVVGFLVLYLLFQVKVLLYVSLSVGVLSLMSKAAANGILWIWNHIALVLGWINTRILLAVVFYLFLYPVAMLYRLSARNPLRLRNTDTSMFDTRNHKYISKDLENIW
jgi:hypothetical protein